MLWLFLFSCSLFGPGINVFTKPRIKTCGEDFSPIGLPGTRRLAVIVTVSDYAHGVAAPPDPDDAEPGVLYDLSAPAKDQTHMLGTLRGLGFPPQNICTLSDAEATHERITDLLRWLGGEPGLLGALPPQPREELVLYFSGHGTRRPDTNHDEPDSYDEALLPHDARMQEGPFLSDDDLRAHLTAIHGALKEEESGEAVLTVIIDACDSGTITRGVSLDPLTAGQTGALPGLVTLSAARDNTEAYGFGSGSLFTTSLGSALRSRRPGETWGQVAKRTQRLMAQRQAAHAREGVTFSQVPAFEGALSRPLTSIGGGMWSDGHVTDTDPLTIALVNPAGWGPGATIEILPAGASPAVLADPLRSRRHATVETLDGFTATARVADTKRPVRVNDKVILNIPSEHSGAGSLMVEVSSELEATVADSILAVAGVIEGRGGFTVQPTEDGLVELRDGAGRLRNRVPADEVSYWIQKHARQQAILAMTDSLPHAGFAVSAVSPPGVPQAWEPPCAVDGTQLLPAGAKWQPKVVNISAPSVTVTGLLLTSDGCVQVVPPPGQPLTLANGQSSRLQPGWAFQAEGGPAPHELLVIGTPAELLDGPDWANLDTSCDPRGARGAAVPPPGGVWLHRLTLQVADNPALEETACQAPALSDAFSIVPYQPSQSALGRSLTGGERRLHALLGGIAAGTHASVADALDAEGIAPLSPCDGRLETGDVLTLAPDAAALVVDPDRGLLWSEGTWLLGDARAVLDCARDPDVSRPLPDALCLSCGGAQ